MPIKKSELYSSLWQSCDELRGGMDASQYKDYVLVLIEKEAATSAKVKDAQETLMAKVAALAVRVDEHLKKMGFKYG